MANAIELQLLLNDQMTSGLLRSNAAVGGYAKSLQELEKAATSVAGVLGIAVGAVIALGAGAFKAAVDLSQQVEQLGNLSAQTGIATDKLQVLQFAFRQGGVDASSLTQGLNFLNRAIASNDPALAKLGVTSNDTFEAFMQAARGIAATTDSTQRAKLAFDIFGRGGAQIVPLLLQLANNFNGFSDSAERSGNVLNQFQIDALNELDKKLDRAGAAWEGFFKRLGSGVATISLPILDKLEKFLQTIGASSSDPLMRALFGGFVETKNQGIRTGGADGPTVNGVTVSATRLKPIDFGGARLWSEPDQMGLRGGGRGSLSSMIGPLAEQTKLQLTEAGKAFAKFADQVAHSFDIIGQHVYSGFFTVLSQLTSKTQTFASSMKTLWRSIVDGILAAMADLISSAITKAFLKLLGAALGAITGNVGFIFGAGTAAGDLFGNSVSPGSVPGAGTASLGAGGNTFVIQTFDAKSTLGAIINPTGSLRSANDRLFEIGAVS